MGDDAQFFEGHVVRFERSFPISVERLWAYLTTEEGLPCWLAEGVIGPGEANLRFSNNDSAIRGRVRIWEPPLRVEFDWSGGPTQPDGSRVRFEVSVQGDGARLVLTHFRVDAGKAADFAAGWHRHLDELMASAEGREPTSDRPSWTQLHHSYEDALARQRTVA